LWVALSPDEIAGKMGRTVTDVMELLAVARAKMTAARLQRPTPYIDKTVYTNWNALCTSAYLHYARVTRRSDARHFALRSIDRILAEAWDSGHGLSHVIAYGDPVAEKRFIPGLLDDYAYTVLACLDAYEISGALSYFRFAREIADEMLRRFSDSTSGGFFDTEEAADDSSKLGALTTRRKPYQDAPTPAGNPCAAIALLRLYSYTNDSKYREKAEDTLEVFAGAAEQFGIYAGSYGLAASWLASPYTQIVVVGEDQAAEALLKAACAAYAVNLSVVHLTDSEAVARNLPPALAETIPNLPALKEKRAFAVVCSNFTCLPPIDDPEQLAAAVRQTIAAPG
jgi:uncharacterized protein YyaL (SSP411 family)